MDQFVASDDQLLLQSSSLLRMNIAFSTFLAFSTFISTIFCVRLMRKHPIFNSSTEILLYFAVALANLHDFFHCVLQFWQLYRAYFYATDRYLIFFNSQECMIVSRPLLFSISGLIFIHSALSIDCAMATFMPARYYSLDKLPGLVIGVIVLVISMMVNVAIVPLADPRVEYLPSCQFFPSFAAFAANLFFILAIFLSVLNLLVNIFLLNVNKTQFKRARFDVNFQYQRNEAIMTSKAISVLLIAQISALCVYLAGSFAFRANRSAIPDSMYHNLVIWVYAIPYMTCSLPILIILSIKYVRRKRQYLIRMVTSRKESQEDRMDELKLMWS